jgi:hypothetical protein
VTKCVAKVLIFLQLAVVAQKNSGIIAAVFLSVACSDKRGIVHRQSAPLLPLNREKIIIPYALATSSDNKRFEAAF